MRWFCGSFVCFNCTLRISRTQTEKKCVNSNEWIMKEFSSVAMASPINLNDWHFGFVHLPNGWWAESRVIFLWSLRWPVLQTLLDQHVASCWARVEFWTCQQIFQKGVLYSLWIIIPSVQGTSQFIISWT